MHRRPATCLRLQLLGTPRWTTEHGGDDLSALDALLAARVAVLGRPNSAQEVGLLWPEHAGSQVNRLDVRLNRLRDKIGHEVFNKTKDSIELLPGVEVDVLGSPGGWPQGQDPRALRFLAGVEAPPTLAVWLAEQRERWAKALAAAAGLRRAAELESAGAIGAALDLARSAVDAAPWLADAWLTKARLLYLSGDLDDASRTLARALALGPLHAVAQATADDLRRTLDNSLAPTPRVVPLPASLIRPPRLIGRDAAWAAMEKAWAARRPLVLVGEAGVGKSRLLEEFLRDHGGGMLIAADYRGERAPYSTLGALLGRVVEHRGLEAGEVPAALAGVLGLLGDRRPEAPVDELAVRHAACDLLAPAAADWRAIVVDRLDRADAASIDVLRSLAEGALRDLFHFGFATRPPVPGPRRDALEAWFAATDGAQAVALVPWRPEHIGELLHTLELPKAAARVTPSALHARTGGVPQLVLFTLQRLASSESQESPAVPPRPLPPDELSALQPRLRAVPSSARPLLELAAVLEADPPLLAKALECSEADVAGMAADLALHGVMFDGRFVHDLMREAALASMAPAAAQRWHAVAASLLAPDLRVPRARIAALWEAAERWPEAAAAYRAAGLHAEDMGRIDAAHELLHQAAACAVRANDPGGEFQALHDVLTTERHLAGHEAAGKLLGRLQALAVTPRQRVQVAVARALLEVSRYRRDGGALPLADAACAAADAGADAELRAVAMSLHAVALAQAGRHVEAVGEGRRARHLAALATTPRQAREIGSHLSYVFYEASQLGDGISLSRELLADYEAANDLAGAASLEGNLAMLLQLSGNPSASIVHLRRALARHREVERHALGDMAVMHRAGLAQALGYEGRFAEALTQLFEEGRCIDTAPVLPSVRAKVQLVHAHLLLLLGDDAGAVAALDDDDTAWPMAMQVQRCWALARAAAMRGEDAAAWLARIGELMDPTQDLPLAHAPWLEWSRQGNAAQVDDRLRDVHRRYVEAGMTGTARSVLLRRIDRLGELRLSRDRDEATALAAALRDELREGLHATIYLPEAWLILARALGRGGNESAATACLTEARQWVRETTLPRVPIDRREAFMTCNPINRGLFQSTGDPG